MLVDGIDENGIGDAGKQNGLLGRLGNVIEWVLEVLGAHRDPMLRVCANYLKQTGSASLNMISCKSPSELKIAASMNEICTSWAPWNLPTTIPYVSTLRRWCQNPGRPPPTPHSPSHPYTHLSLLPIPQP